MRQDAGYFPLADVCCRLFVVAPEKLSARDSRRLNELILGLDQKLLSISLPSLLKIPTLFLIGGGSRKALALSQFLTSGHWLRCFLCTDVDTARMMLEPPA